MPTRSLRFQWPRCFQEIATVCATVGNFAACSPETSGSTQALEILPLPLECSSLDYKSRDFPLRVEPGRRYLVTADGHPYLLTGDAAWSLIAQLREADIDRYLDDRKSRRFNTILVNLLEARYASNAPANIYGERPFPRRETFGTQRGVLQSSGFRHPKGCRPWIARTPRSCVFRVRR